jgi:sugar phosphate isomerase/epimerase
MHPGFVVYNPVTLLRLREQCGDNIGANLDPSHLFWQGIELEDAIAELGRHGAIFHVHAKDTVLLSRARVNGVLDTAPLSEPARRSWIFCTVGYGHDELYWKRLLMGLRAAGYDDVISIEHEDVLMSLEEGFEKGVAFLRKIMPIEPAVAAPWWTA